MTSQQPSEPTRPADWMRAHRRLVSGGFFAWAAFTAGIGWLSLWLNGNDVWKTVSVIAAAAIVIVGGRFLIEELPRLKAGHILVLGGVALTWGGWFCGGLLAPRLLPPWTTITSYDTGWDQQHHRVLYGGEVVGETGPSQGNRVAIERRDFDEGRLRVEVFTPDGWVARGFTLQPDTEPNRLRPNDRFLKLSLKDLRTTDVYVDNRQRPDASLVCGQMRFSVLAGRQATFTFPVPRVPNETPLRVNGETAGPVNGGWFLVDTSAQRRYRFRKHLYVKPQQLREATLSLLQRRAPSAGRRETLDKKLLHQLPNPVADFLTSSPERLDRQVLLGPGSIRTVHLNKVPDNVRDALDPEIVRMLSVGGDERGELLDAP